MLEFLLSPCHRGDAAGRVYPPREFPNLPSYEESLDLWRAELDQVIPCRRRLALVCSIILGALFLLISLLSFASMPTRVADGSLAPELLYLSGVLMFFLPLMYLGWAFIQMPIKPTKEHHRKALELMRVFRGSQLVKVGDE